MNDQAASLWTALKALPKPVTLADTTACAEQELGGVKAKQFAQWAERNADYLLGKLNG